MYSVNSATQTVSIIELFHRSAYAGTVLLIQEFFRPLIAVESDRNLRPLILVLAGKLPILSLLSFGRSRQRFRDVSPPHYFNQLHVTSRSLSATVEISRNVRALLVIQIQLCYMHWPGRGENACTTWKASQGSKRTSRGIGGVHEFQPIAPCPL